MAGIYLILDTKTGRQYVGSAYEKDGILGRWTNYAKTCHGGNKLLIELIDQNGNEYANHFRFSILQPLNKEMTKNEVIKLESLYKTKLGTLASGLNMN